MTNSMNHSNYSIPAYSGITINISNPTLNAAPLNQHCKECNTNYPNLTVESLASQGNAIVSNPSQYGVSNPIEQNKKVNVPTVDNVNLDKNPTVAQPENLELNKKINSNNELPQTYPPQYYLNNYNYIQNGEKTASRSMQDLNSIDQNLNSTPENIGANTLTSEDTSSTDMSSSQNIINDLDNRLNQQKELEENGKQTRVIALTNEYIMSLENYLNNPNSEIRLMASKEILTRLDEDKNRFDDAALNALLNKMLQDPDKLIRIAALSAFSSQLASGNDYTVKLLTDIQNNPNADKEDVVQAADCLLKMSSSTEIKYTPVENNNSIPQNESQVE